jgi:putative oxidoreductase
MNSLIDAFRQMHDGFFGTLEKITNGWFFGLFARFVFASTLYVYYLNSAKTKIGKGLLGFLEITDGAYVQIAGPAFEAAGYEQSAMPLPAHIMVFMGTYGEFILPVLVIIGLFSRIGASGMIAFIFVQTYVDVSVHSVALGSLFNGQPGDILDQRLFWLVPLLYVVLKGPGAISLDNILSRWWTRRMHGSGHPLSNSQPI